MHSVDRATRRRAGGGGEKGIGEAHALSREPVEVGRRDVRVPGKPRVVPGHVTGDDKALFRQPDLNIPGAMCWTEVKHLYSVRAHFN